MYYNQGIVFGLFCSYLLGWSEFLQYNGENKSKETYLLWGVLQGS